MLKNIRQKSKSFEQLPPHFVFIKPIHIECSVLFHVQNNNGNNLTLSSKFVGKLNETYAVQHTTALVNPIKVLNTFRLLQLIYYSKLLYKQMCGTHIFHIKTNCSKNYFGY